MRLLQSCAFFLSFFLSFYFEIVGKSVDCVIAGAIMSLFFVLTVFLRLLTHSVWSMFMIDGQYRVHGSRGVTRGLHKSFVSIAINATVMPQ